jgi:hypothetical protein
LMPYGCHSSAERFWTSQNDKTKDLKRLATQKLRI